MYLVYTSIHFFEIKLKSIEFVTIQGGFIFVVESGVKKWVLWKLMVDSIQSTNQIQRTILVTFDSCKK